MSRRTVCLIGLVAAAFGCSKKREQPPAPAPAPAIAEGVGVLRDGAPVATVPAAGFDSGQPLSSVTELGPAAEWRLVTVRGDGGRELYVRDPAREYQGHTIKLYRDPRGRAAVGVFRDGASADATKLSGLAAAPVVFLAGVSSIDVRTQKEELPAAPASSIELRVRGSDQPITLDGARLASLPEVKPPDQREGSSGWSLREVIAAGHAFTGAPAIELVDEAGTRLEIPAGALADDKQLLFIKLNRRGQFRFKWWQLTGAAPTGQDAGKAAKNVKLLGELRAVRAIHLR
jgi:hypothetical protein